MGSLLLTVKDNTELCAVYISIMFQGTSHPNFHNLLLLSCIALFCCFEALMMAIQAFDTLLQALLSSIKEGEMTEDFMATQAAAEQLQNQLTQQQQTFDTAVADEKAKEQAHKYNQSSLFLLSL